LTGFDRLWPGKVSMKTSVIAVFRRNQFRDNVNDAACQGTRSNRLVLDRRIDYD